MTNLTELQKKLGIPAGKSVCFCDPDGILPEEFSAVESIEQYYDAVEKYRKNILMKHAVKGVVFDTFDGVVIAPDAQIGSGTVIHTGTQIRGGVKIGEGCVIGPCSVIENSSIGNNCTVNATQVYSSEFEDNVKIGPFCHVRPGSKLFDGVKVGDFVEIKNSNIGSGTHASHLTYIGDSDVGSNVNFGCGVVTVNYDGKNKSRTVIGDNAFIGCNTNLVAPVKIGDYGYTGAGSTITRDVPSGALAVERAEQRNIEGWVLKKHKLKGT